MGPYLQHLRQSGLDGKGTNTRTRGSVDRRTMGMHPFVNGSVQIRARQKQFIWKRYRRRLRFHDCLMEIFVRGRHTRVFRERLITVRLPALAARDWRVKPDRLLIGASGSLSPKGSPESRNWILGRPGLVVFP